MTNDANVIEAFSALSYEEKADLLLQLGHELTMLARLAYEPGTEGVTRPRWLRAINEIQHRIFGFLLPLLREDARRYPDETLVKILLEGWGDPELACLVRKSFERFVPTAAQKNGPPIQP
jgi:hypothetical protein